MNKKEFEKELDEKLASLKEEMMQKFEEQEDEFPKVGNRYYYITASGNAGRASWVCDEFDRSRLAIGNVFQTEGEAKFVCKRLKVIAELKKFAEPKDNKWDGENNHCYFLWDYIRNKIVYFYRSNVKGEGIYFESEEKAKKAIEAVGADRVKKYYLGVTE